MNVVLVEIENKQDELVFNIVDRDININIGILFTVGNHIAYEIKPEFRGQGAATAALKKITSQMKKPVLEITYNNIASKKVALKAGYSLVRIESPFEIYEYSNESEKTR
jgi:predicted acetyltransferase